MVMELIPTKIYRNGAFFKCDKCGFLSLLKSSKLRLYEAGVFPFRCRMCDSLHEPGAYGCQSVNDYMLGSFSCSEKVLAQPSVS